jgi:hypothetical protein
MKLDDSLKITTSLGWLSITMVALLAFAIRGALWMAHTDERIYRIEEKMGIKHEMSNESIFDEAHADYR